MLPTTRVRLKAIFTIIIVFWVISGAIFFVYIFFRPLPYGPLQRAAREGDLRKVEFLLSSGTDINQACRFRNWTALHAATDAGQVDVAKYLLDHGAKLEVEDDNGLTPLALAGCAPNARPHPKETEARRNEIAILLIHHGANINAKTKYGWTPRDCARNGNDVALTTILRDLGGH